MSTYAAAYLVLFLVGLLFGSLPFIGGLRALPRWIRIALLMIGISFFFGAAFGIVLNAAAPRLSPQMYSLLPYFMPTSFSCSEPDLVFFFCCFFPVSISRRCESWMQSAGGSCPLHARSPATNGSNQATQRTATRPSA